MAATITPVFNRKNQLNKNGKGSIELCLYQNRKRKYISTGIKVSPDQWDEKRQVINKKHNDAELLNYQIKERITNFETSKVEHLMKGKSFSIHSITNNKAPQDKTSFIEFVREEVKNDQTLKYKTKQSHNNTVNKLLEYNKEVDIKFDDVTYTFIDNFLNYLRKNKLAINTVHKLHKNIKKYIDIAIKKEYYHLPNPCKEIKVKSEHKKREIITLDEMNEIENLDLSKFEEKISTVRDI